MTHLRSHLTQGHSVHSEISPAPRTPSPSLESIIPKSVVIICTQQFCRFLLRFGIPGISRKSFCKSMHSELIRFFSRLARLDTLFKRHSFLCDSSDTHRICFPEVRQLRPIFPSSLATIDIRSVPSRTPLALRVQTRAFMHTPGTSRATLVLRAQTSLEAKQVSTNAMYPLAGPVGQ